MAPTPRGYPTFTGAQPPAGMVQMQMLADAIDADVTELHYDTGWINTGIAYLNTFTAGTTINGYRPFTFRRRGELIWANGSIQRPTAWAGGAIALQMPVGARPGRQLQSPDGYMQEDGKVVLFAAGGALGQVILNFFYMRA